MYFVFLLLSITAHIVHQTETDVCQMEFRFTFFVVFVSDPSVDDSGAVSPDQDDKQDREKMEKHKKKLNKATRPKHNEAKGHSIFGWFPMSSDNNNITFSLHLSVLTLFYISCRGEQKASHAHSR